MRDSVIRELVSLSFLSTADGVAARKYSLETLPKRDLKKFRVYLKNEIKRQHVTVKSAGAADESSKGVIEGVFKDSIVRYETAPGLGAGMEIEHGDDLAKFSVSNIIERAINNIKNAI